MARRSFTIRFLPLLFLTWMAGCGPRAGEPQKPLRDLPAAAQAVSNPGGVVFTEIAQQAGISFQHNNGAAGKKNMPETVRRCCSATGPQSKQVVRR